MSFATVDQELEQALRDIGTNLYREASRGRPALFNPHGLRGRLLSRALHDEALRSALFQFVDVLPQLESAEAVAAHFRAYLSGRPLAGIWGRTLALGNYPLMSKAVRASVERIARLFLVEENQQALGRALRELRRIPAEASVDAVGEAVLTDAEAAAYLKRNLDLLRWLEQAGEGAPNLSIKLSALTPRFDPLDPSGTKERVLRRIGPLVEEVRRMGAALTVDMEQVELQPIILEIFRALVAAFPDRRWLPGIAVQAYLHSARRDLMDLVNWAESVKRRVCIRLVKGAYWDTEVALARQRRWPVPVYLSKGETDASYEQLTELLFDHPAWIYPAIASHNLRSLSHALAVARARRRPADSWEAQMLFGMAGPLGPALAALGVTLRIYLPTGELLTGIAYLIRRLLENTASTSILRQTFADAADADSLLAAPRAGTDGTTAGAQAERHAFANMPFLDFSRAEFRELMQQALARARASLSRQYPLPVHGAAAEGEHVSINPAKAEEVLGVLELTGIAGAERAVNNAAAAFPGWRDTAAEERVRLCLLAAGLMTAKRAELAAWEVLEAGKNWREADADVAEAIDYLRYYAGEMAKLAGWRATRCFPGERNHSRYEPRGVAVIIPPWNFPLAILTGMTAAALVAGNAVIMKPALNSQIIARRLLEVLHDAGFPPDACQLLPAKGAVVGDYLVSHPRVHVIAFTGSREVGLGILHKAHENRPGQTHVKQVVCEMGGKNAIIVDEDADLDEAVIQTLYSAFGYQGQKCSAASRLIAVGKIHDRLVSRLAGALECYPLGPPEEPQYLLGPVISREARDKAETYLEIGGGEGRLYYQGAKPAGTGLYVAPAIFTGILPRHRLAQEEIFAPILAVLRADDFDRALDIALDSDYALTGGVFSRSPEHLERARERFRVGNLYLNRRITGALVATQPFGGPRLSGTGIQAGGPDYLKQFMWSRVVSENTLRHGLVA